MPTGDAYSSWHLVPSLWDLHMFYLLRPILFRTCRYLLDYALRISLGTFPILLIAILSPGQTDGIQTKHARNPLSTFFFISDWSIRGGSVAGLHVHDLCQFWKLPILDPYNVYPCWDQSFSPLRKSFGILSTLFLQNCCMDCRTWSIWVIYID